MNQFPESSLVSARDRLRARKSKRDFTQTPEPAVRGHAVDYELSVVVQKKVAAKAVTRRWA
jgi:hypothetical protein